MRKATGRWKTMAIRRRSAMMSEEPPVTSSSPIQSRPLLGRMSRSRMRMSELFPPPDGPISPKDSPFETSRLISSSTVFSPASHPRASHRITRALLPGVC